MPGSLSEAVFQSRTRESIQVLERLLRVAFPHAKAR